MLAQVLSGAMIGVDALLVRVEVDVAPGLPAISVVGLPESAVREGRERVAAALHNAGFDIPSRRITINLAPADVRKEGSAFDLPIALGLLCASGVLPPPSLGGLCCLGELGLDGELRPVRGAISVAFACAEAGVRCLVLPAANAAEAAVVEALDVRAAVGLGDVVRHLTGHAPLTRTRLDPSAALAGTPTGPRVDFADVRGQQHARRALEVAAAGGHNTLLEGPPGAGKSMLARRMPTILPPLTLVEAIEVTRVHSAAGRLRPGNALVERRPFRAPHHSVSEAGLVGGGPVPRPGEASLAHHGVLFLDEFPEFQRRSLESLRQPLEDGSVHIGRARVGLTFPARFMLIAAMNPCPCGFHGDGVGRCICHVGEVRRYRSRLSGPLLDRIDLHVDVPALSPRELQAQRPGEPSAAIRARVVAARERQLARLRYCAGVFANAQMGVREVRQYCRLERDAEVLLRTAMERLGMSARAYHRTLRIARTIADLGGAESIATEHLAEAIQYRKVDRRLAVEA